MGVARGVTIYWRSFCLHLHSFAGINPPPLLQTVEEKSGSGGVDYVAIIVLLQVSIPRSLPKRVGWIFMAMLGHSYCPDTIPPSPTLIDWDTLNPAAPSRTGLNGGGNEIQWGLCLPFFFLSVSLCLLDWLILC